MGATFKEFDLVPTDLEFSIYSSDEIKSLSVVKIITGLTFNQLGHALPGGLYDSAMGVSGKVFEVCQTCMGQSNCPGHFGHIELNTVVYNPFFIKLAHDILKISCLNCNRLQFKEQHLNILKLQLQLIDAGFVIEAQQIDIFKSEVVLAASTEKNVKTESGTEMHPEIAKMHEILNRGETNKINCTKTSNEIRSQIINAFLHSFAGNKCLYCHNPLRKIRFVYRKLMIYMPKTELRNLKETEAGNNEDKGKDSSSPNKVVFANECQDYLRKIFKENSEILQEIFPIFKIASNSLYSPVDIFFMDTILVTPPSARPCNYLHNEIVEHPQTAVYRSILESNSVLRLIMLNIQKGEEELKDEAKAVYQKAQGSNAHEKLYYAIQELQTCVDQLLDINLGRENTKSFGLKQVLEKKEGLIRKHMMGKRVNYAARTVITPDPNINVEELGVPDIFAKKLSYPVPVTSWNCSELRKMVINGPDIHPGANYIVDPKGHKILIPANDPAKRESLAKLLFRNPENGISVVHRHLLNGDIMLLNRQPTLHRPSIMAHKARILQGEKTFRLHYSNCKAYNADFDGDEMNAHLPQSEVARAEAYGLANVANHYLVPKDGTPLGGLIQDHIISGVKLSVRGRFFNREDYHQLVFQGLSDLKGDIKLLPPAIMKPIRLWSGKQILSTIILNLIPEGYPGINLTSSAKVGAKHWITAPKHDWIHGGTPLKDIEMSESEVIIRNCELLVGILDKQQYGATEFGLVHCMYELYGGHVSSSLLTSFTKLFTVFLQNEGFTLGVKDILVTPEADKKRRKIIKESRQVGMSIVAEALELQDVPDLSDLASKIEAAYLENPKFRTILDRKYKSILDEYTNQINQVCLPKGLISHFPFNNLQLMVLSGAKGSMVNTMQISSLLGQIELEGKRPPLMISGKSLPSFPSFETSPKSGGFIDGRFMTGIQPQDFFFHCMAGREGLIDTAVKTSRSGYLQRCLIKHLEGINVSYDLTVRDSDNSVVQYLYGEDGLDVSKSRYLNLKSIKFLDENAAAILHRAQINNLEDENSLEKIHKHNKKLKSWRKKNGNPTEKRRCSSFQQFSSELREEIEMKKPNKMSKKSGRLNIDAKLVELWKKADNKDKYHKKYSHCPDPVISKYKPDNYYGAITEYVENLMNTYLQNNLERKSTIRDVFYTKNITSIVEPGEPVGLLAAQSIGEPSTQMTLNTFHFAGRGEMNVTLGIPRLREILMLASSKIKTPSMDIPFLKNRTKKAEKLRIKLNRVTLSEVLESINVKIRLILRPVRVYEYKLKFSFLPKEAYEDEFCVKPKQILKFMDEHFFKMMFKLIKRNRYSKDLIEISTETENSKQKDDDIDEQVADKDDQKGSKNAGPAIEIDDSSDDDFDEDDATGVKLKAKKQDENDYEDPDEVEEIEDADYNEDNESVNLDNENDKNENEDDDNKEEFIVTSNEMVKNYIYDKENYRWCQLTFNLAMKDKIVDISTLLKNLAEKSVVYEVPKIKRAITYTNNDDLILKTDGINIVEMFKYNQILDLNRLYSNDIHAIANTYGIEAATRVIVKEIQNVFKVYGITVNPRHLLLVADYMTFDGIFKPLSRKGMEFSSSPLQQMSFESSLKFLKDAAISGRTDELNSPSSRLMVGLPVKNGTGSFTLLNKYV
ncbi:DNA-directed RNA polymerase I subunit RPA1, partial [Condylostylus longicornis]|uniref:DNA-directed RNA polymerase I subunit RPA1 n=1 Tax=Condylostylus longicornis TaxID=2530218 RepID=UPI00244DF1F0